MSVIQRIRDKAAWLIFGAIALAMIGFIVTDAFQGRGRGLFGGPNTTYGRVNGKKIDYQDYQKRLKLVEDQYRGQMNDFMRQRSAENLWNQMVDEILLGKIYSQLGLQVTDKEVGDILYGSHPPEQLRQQFTNQQTGQYDANTAYQTILEFKKRSPQQYQMFIESVIENRQREKYLAMISNTAYAPKWMAEKMGADNSLIANISYVRIPYSSITDSSIKVSDEEIKAFIEKRSEEYQQEKSRSIAYVAFSAAPSTADSAAVRDKLKALSGEFASTSDIKAFLLRSNSELPYYEGFISKARIQVPQKDSILKTPVGGIYGPYLDQKNYVLAKVVGEKQMPDTVKVRHILIGTQQQDPQTGQAYRLREDSTAKRIADSVQLAIRNGANFDSLLMHYSDDLGSKNKGGVFDSVPTFQMVPAFNDFIFTNPAGTKGVIQTDFGYHYIEILSQKGSAPAYKIAYLASPIFTSPETENSASGLASQFAAQNRTASKFDESVSKNPALQKLIIPDIHPGDYSVGELGSSRELVRWIYEADKGDVVDQPFSIGDKYVVAELIEINEQGLMSPQKARPTVEGLVRNHKKAEQILQKLGNANNLEAVASANKQQVLRADSISFPSPFIPNVGQEMKVIGASFNKQMQGKVMTPIEGATGIFVMKPESISAKPNPNASLENTRTMLEQQLRSVGFRSLEAIKKAATIKDYREKF